MSRHLAQAQLGAHLDNLVAEARRKYEPTDWPGAPEGHALTLRSASVTVARYEVVSRSGDDQSIRDLMVEFREDIGPLPGRYALVSISGPGESDARWRVVVTSVALWPRSMFARLCPELVPNDYGGVDLRTEQVRDIITRLFRGAFPPLPR